MAQAGYLGRGCLTVNLSMRSAGQPGPRGSTALLGLRGLAARSLRDILWLSELLSLVWWSRGDLNP